jgi:Winged helix-turn helix
MLKTGSHEPTAPKIQLSTKEKETLLRWMRSAKTEQRMVQRARVILLAASGMDGKQIALKMQTRAARISKWLRRFAKDGVAGLNDSARSGEKRRKYTGAPSDRLAKALTMLAQVSLLDANFANFSDSSAREAA